MIKIYILNVNNLQTQSFADLVSSLPFGESEEQRLCAIGNSKHRWESLGGLIALKRLCESESIALPLSISRTPSGKPYFTEKQQLGFGISHSSGFAAAAIDTAGHQHQGFDLEVVDDKYDFVGISNRFFTPEELKSLDNSGNTAESFFGLWTLKEARGKADGRGLSALMSNDTDVKLNCWQTTIHANNEKICIALCRSKQIRGVKITTDGDDIFEL